MTLNIIEITDTNFENEVKNSPLPVLVDFWAEWCGPCKMLAPVLSEIAKEFDGKLKVGKLNVDQHSDVPSTLGIRSLPTMMLFKDGQIVDTKIGYSTKENLVEWLDKHAS